MRISAAAAAVIDVPKTMSVAARRWPSAIALDATLRRAAGQSLCPVWPRSICIDCDTRGTQNNYGRERMRIAIVVAAQMAANPSRFNSNRTGEGGCHSASTHATNNSLLIHRCIGVAAHAARANTSQLNSIARVCFVAAIGASSSSAEAEWRRRRRGRCFSKNGSLRRRSRFSESTSNYTMHFTRFGRNFADASAIAARAHTHTLSRALRPACGQHRHRRS